MSNEPKWHIVHQLGDDAAIYDRQKQLFNVHTDEAQRICDVLNRLEKENAELRERLKRLEQDLDAATSPEVLANVVTKVTPEQAAKLRSQNPIVGASTTTRTDADGWISVQDRLPEHGKYVLAHYYENPRLTMINTWKYNKDNPHWTNGTFTHWMPLPEPPQQFRSKEGEQNG